MSSDTGEASVLLPASLPLEGKAVTQLMDFASVCDGTGVLRVLQACATPDFHPGAIAPVGTIVATDQDFVIPAAIGTDINCGMRLMATGLKQAAMEPLKERVISRLSKVLLENERNIPVRTQAFRALFDDGPSAFIGELHREGLWADADLSRMLNEMSACVGLDSFKASSVYAPDALIGRREVIRDPCLGTVGSGNHFVELQIVESVLDRHAAYRAGLAIGDVVVMIHTGSRDVGFYVGQRWMDRAKTAWPKHLKHPESGLFGLSGVLAQDYLKAMGVAARYAWANRVALAELVRREIAQLSGCDSSHLVVDVPHNVILQENGFNIHRKGATPAHSGEWALIPGSMGDASYLAVGMGHEDWLWSCSHGAGRQMRRQDTRRAIGNPVAGTWQCVTLKEERRVEEAPAAYKPIGPVIEAQEQAGLIKAAVKLSPWVTFKA